MNTLFLVFWVAGLVVSAPLGEQPAKTIPTPVAGAIDTSSVKEREASAIQSLQRLNGGYFQLVDDPAERANAKAAMQRRLHSIGIKAEIRECDWMGLVAQGTKDGNNSYGAACKVRINGQPERSLLICNADLGGLSLIEPDWYAWDASYIELFIRRACL